MRDIISSMKNAGLKNVSALLKSKKERDEQGLFVIEGLRIFKDAVKSAPERIAHVYVSESQYERLCGLNETGFDFDDARVDIVRDSVFEAVSNTVTPQGIIALIAKTECVADLFDLKNARLLILEDIQDPGNLGTLIRTAEAAGMTGVIMSRGTADIYNPKVIRSTMGSVFRVAFTYVDNLPEELKRLREDGIHIYAAYLGSGRPYNEIEYAKRFGVMIGNEGNGLTDEAVSAADECVYIPMSGEVESLNASVAGALMMYRASEIK